MGVVYMAEQAHPVRRKVALKIIKPGMDSRQVIARFEAERQALTMMDHPNIAKVLDAGTTDSGRPYFVMELVKGIPITDYCDQARLSMQERLALFITVCNAVQHAHQKGIIHRDLKPTNVLVTLHDDKPVPKVIDFGIAKAAGQVLTDKTLFTNYAQMLGTPLYMSPEQAQISGLDVDTRSDVYSLGVLLYELLTGTTPFDGRRLREAAYDEMRRIIREEDPPKPSTRVNTLGEKLTTVSADRHTDPKKLGQLMRGELDWIVMKALEKERARRYETASSLARDVERYLSDETVQACPPSARYRLRKLVRRHRTAVLTVSLVTMALLLAVVVLAISNARVTTERNQKAAALRDRELALGEKAAALLAANEQAFRALWNEARARRLSRQAGQRLASLAALTQAARMRPDEGLRDEAIAIMAQPDVTVGPAWQTVAALQTSPLVSAAFDEGYRVLHSSRPSGDSTHRVRASVIGIVAQQRW
jgi:predicted nucleic acid-binding protein